MPLRQNNTRVFHRHLYAGQLLKITLLKRNNDLGQGTVKSYTLFQCRRGDIVKMGQTIQGAMTTIYRATWQIPSIELLRVGINYLNALDRVVEDHDQGNRVLTQERWLYWQPEGIDDIHIKTFGNTTTLSCQLVNPPTNNPF